MQPTNSNTTSQNTIESAATTQNPESARNNPEILPLELRGLVNEVFWASLTIEQKLILQDLESLPKQLEGIVPDSVWKTLSAQQKLEFLHTHGVLPKDVVTGAPERVPGFDGPMGGVKENRPESSQHTELIEEPSQPTVETKSDKAQNEVLVNQQSESRAEFAKVVEEVEKIKNEEEAALEAEATQEGNVQLSADEQQRIDMETGQAFNTKTIPKMTGYAISDDVANNATVYATQSVNNGTTWASNILQKLWAVFGN